MGNIVNVSKVSNKTWRMWKTTNLSEVSDDVIVYGRAILTELAEVRHVCRGLYVYRAVRCRHVCHVLWRRHIVHLTDSTQSWLWCSMALNTHRHILVHRQTHIFHLQDTFWKHLNLVHVSLIYFLVDGLQGKPSIGMPAPGNFTTVLTF